MANENDVEMLLSTPLEWQIETKILWFFFQKNS